MKLYKDSNLSDSNITLNRYTKSIVMTNGNKSINYEAKFKSYGQVRTENVNAIKQKIAKQNDIRSIQYVKGIIQADVPYHLADITRNHRCAQCVYQSSKKWYNKKSFRTIKKLTELINLIYEKRDKQKQFYWVTLTTIQHKTGKSDKELFYALKLYLQHRRVSYICVAERQRQTGDLHFHLIVEQKADFDIRREQRRLALLFSTLEHPALYDVKRVFNVKQLVSYISKYVRKSTPTWETLNRKYTEWAAKAETNKNGHLKPFKAPYSSLFQCRTFTYSGDIGKRYKECYHEFSQQLPNSVFAEYSHFFTQKYKAEFYSVYEWSNELWQLACHLRKERLSKLESDPLTVIHKAMLIK